MARTMKDYSGAKYSNATVTPTERNTVKKQKKFCNSKKGCIFATSSYRRTVMLSIIMGIFYAHTLYGAPTPCIDCNGQCRRPTDDLTAGSGAPFFYSSTTNNLISSMSSRNQIARGKKHSTPASTPDCESVNLGKKQYDFSKFHEYFDDVIDPQKVVTYLEELRTEYLKLLLHVLFQDVGKNPIRSYFVHCDIHKHLDVISELINLIKTI
jgi:hypothetical protein